MGWGQEAKRPPLQVSKNVRPINTMRDDVQDASTQLFFLLYFLIRRPSVSCIGTRRSSAEYRLMNGINEGFDGKRSRSRSQQVLDGYYNFFL